VPDDSHNHAANKNALTYEIAPSISIRIDPREYAFWPLTNSLDLTHPNSIHLIRGARRDEKIVLDADAIENFGKDEYFHMPWTGKAVVEVDATALRNLKGITRFSGFRTGETYTLGIGLQSTRSKQAKLEFWVMWAGMIKVK